MHLNVDLSVAGNDLPEVDMLSCFWSAPQGNAVATFARLLPFWSAPNSKQQAECQTAPAQTRMAALLESLLQKEVEAIKAVEWLKHDGVSDNCKPEIKWISWGLVSIVLRALRNVIVERM